MTPTDTDTGTLDLLDEARKLLQAGEVSEALELYSRVFDPDSTDEGEARNMLIDARAHFARKHLVEALECFEEALMMGTDVQRRQALEGIAEIGEIRKRLKKLTPQVAAGLKKILGKSSLESKGLMLTGEDGNILVISDEALAGLPEPLAKSPKVTRIPPFLTEDVIPFPASRCVPYTEQEDIDHIIKIAEHLAAQ